MISFTEAELRGWPLPKSYRLVRHHRYRHPQTRKAALPVLDAGDADHVVREAPSAFTPSGDGQEAR